MEWNLAGAKGEGEVESHEQTWGEREFRAVELGDKRLERRLKVVAEDLAARPQAPLNQASADWAATKAAYRFFENPKASEEKIFAAHRTCTVQRLQGRPVVLAIQDTSYLNYSHHPQTRGLGPIGDSRSDAQGLLMHSTLVATPEGLPLGLLSQKLWVRTSYSQQSARERKNTAIEQKESYRWLEALQETMAWAPASSQVVTLCDREADIYEFLAKAQHLEAKVVLRGAWDRHIEHDDFPRLWSLLAGQAVAGYLTIELPAREKRQPRRARLALRFTAVTLTPPQRHRAAVPHPLPSLALSAVYVKEVTPPPGEPALEWMLLTNLVVHTVEEALQRVEWYRRRWLVEEFHKILKSGCRIEACRLQTAQRLMRYVTLCSVIAWRLYWLTHSHRMAPTAPATTILAPEEIAALQTLSSGPLPSAPSLLTTREAVRLIAKLGGFLGRRHDGEPGITVIWRGWQRLSDLALMWSLVIEGQLVGNS
jgi:Transposase DNA-binding/Transposase Tn5 dimerisation domain